MGRNRCTGRWTVGPLPPDCPRLLGTSRGCPEVQRRWSEPPARYHATRAEHKTSLPYLGRTCNHNPDDGHFHRVERSGTRRISTAVLRNINRLSSARGSCRPREGGGDARQDSGGGGCAKVTYHNGTSLCCFTNCSRCCCHFGRHLSCAFAVLFRDIQQPHCLFTRTPIVT